MSDEQFLNAFKALKGDCSTPKGCMYCGIKMFCAVLTDSSVPVGEKTPSEWTEYKPIK